ncbi:ferritin light chain-like [Prionailurus iriomotensis]
MLFTSHPGSGSSEVPEVGSAPADAKRLGRVLVQSAWVGFLSRTVAASERPGFYPLILGRLLHAREEGVASERVFVFKRRWKASRFSANSEEVAGAFQSHVITLKMETQRE